MSRTTIIYLLLFVLACFCPAAIINAKHRATPLKQGEPIERTITRGKTHPYSVRLEQDQFLQVVTDQHGIEVAMKANAPDGKQVGEASSPGRTNGTEGMTLVARVPGLYQISVTAFEQAGNSGRYEIRILDLRQATKAEMDAVGSQDAIKTKGIALLNETAETIQQIRLPETAYGKRYRWPNFCGLPTKSTPENSSPEQPPASMNTRPPSLWTILIIFRSIKRSSSYAVT